MYEPMNLLGLTHNLFFYVARYKKKTPHSCKQATQLTRTFTTDAQAFPGIVSATAILSQSQGPDALENKHYAPASQARSVEQGTASVAAILILAICNLDVIFRYPYTILVVPGPRINLDNDM